MINKRVVSQNPNIILSKQNYLNKTLHSYLLQLSAVLLLYTFVSFFKLFFSKMADALLIQRLKNTKLLDELQYSSLVMTGSVAELCDYAYSISPSAI